MSAVPRHQLWDPMIDAPSAFDPEPADAPRWPDEIGQVLRAMLAGLGRVIDRPRNGPEPLVDHVVLSPAGLDVVQVRSVTGRVCVRSNAHQERALFLAHEDRTAWLTELDATVAEIGEALGRSPLARVRRGWLCLQGADWHEVPVGIHLGGYPVVPPSLVRQFLPLSGPFRLAHITVAAERLDQVLVTSRRRPGGRTSIRRVAAQAI